MFILHFFICLFILLTLLCVHVMFLTALFQCLISQCLVKLTLVTNWFVEIVRRGDLMRPHTRDETIIMILNVTVIVLWYFWHCRMLTILHNSYRISKYTATWDSQIVVKHQPSKWLATDDLGRHAGQQYISRPSIYKVKCNIPQWMSQATCGILLPLPFAVKLQN